MPSGVVDKAVRRLDRLLLGDEECCRHNCTTPEHVEHRRHVRLVFLTTLVVTICAAIWGLIFVVLGAFWAAFFPFLMMVLSVIGIIHVLVTKSSSWASLLLCYGMSFCALGVHWSFGVAKSDFVFNWVLLGPQLAIPLGRPIKETAVMAVILCAGIVVIQVQGVP